LQPKTQHTPNREEQEREAKDTTGITSVGEGKMIISLRAGKSGNRWIRFRAEQQKKKLRRKESQRKTTGCANPALDG
jgi:hypothetical protein